MQDTPEYSYAVVGCGVYGLSAAYHLAKAGKKLVIFEK